VTDEPDEPLAPEQEHEIRAALASARLTGPTPEDVVTRLDSVLADLVAERDEPRQGAPAQRAGRGRWLLLAAAASVAVVVAFGIPALRPSGSHQGTAAGNSASQGSPRSLAPGTSTPKSGAQGTERNPAAVAPAPLRLQSRSFRSGVRLLLATDDGFGLSPQSGSPRPGSALSGAARSQASDSGQPACPAGTPPAGVTRQRQVLLDGRPALLEVFRPRGGTRLVRAVSCDGIETLASTRIPAP
jgi:hypothetical protein